jgi:hypothetical protein
MEGGYGLDGEQLAGRLAEPGVARVSVGHFLHAEMMDALSARLGALRTGS